MPSDAIDYSNIVFYKIYCNDTLVKDLYIGHTTNFIQRKYAHKRTCNKENDPNHHLKLYKFIREHGGWDNWTMEIIGFHDCYDHYEARKIEHRYFETFGATLNSIEPLPKPKIRPTTILKEKQENNQENVSITEEQETKNELYVCAKCDINCLTKKDYNKHLLTAKHTKTNEDTPETSTLHNCKCGRKYKHIASLCKHKQVCSYIEEPKHEIIQITNKDQIILDLLTQNKELMNTIKDLITKIGNTTTS